MVDIFFCDEQYQCLMADVEGDRSGERLIAVNEKKDESYKAENSSYMRSKSTDLKSAHGSLELEKVDGFKELNLDSKRRYVWFASLFVIKGFADLFLWNSLIAILWNLRADIYVDYPSMTDTLNAANNVTGILTVIYCVKTGSMNQPIIMISGLVQAVVSVLIAVTVQTTSGLAGVIILHLLSAVAGICGGFYQGGGMGLASVMPVPMVNYISTGQGLCGVLSFLLWMLVSHVKLSTRRALWIMMCLGGLVYASATGAYFYLIRMPYVARRVQEVTKTLKEEAQNPEAPTYWFLFKEIWVPTLTVWLAMFATLLIFPTIGPLHWDEGTYTNYVLGTFQFGDFIGRSMATFVALLVLPIQAAFYFAIGRGTFIITFGILCWQLPKVAFFHSKVFHTIFMAILGISGGYLVTCVFVNFPTAVKQENWRSRASSITLLSLLFGITCGLWLARLLTAVSS